MCDLDLESLLFAIRSCRGACLRGRKSPKTQIYVELGIVENQVLAAIGEERRQQIIRNHPRTMTTPVLIKMKGVWKGECAGIGFSAPIQVRDILWGIASKHRVSNSELMRKIVFQYLEKEANNL